MTLDEIRRQLEDRNIQAVARATGIHPNAIYRIMRGKSRPLYETVEKLRKYLEGGGGNGRG